MDEKRIMDREHTLVTKVCGFHLLKLWKPLLKRFSSLTPLTLWRLNSPFSTKRIPIELIKEK